MPKISICIPTHDRAGLLRQAIDSVLAQDMTDWELIISDNASTDHTASVVATYRDPRIRTYRQTENIGMFKNFNAAIQKATGQYVKMLMDDDVLLPACLRRQMEILDQFPSVHVICSDYFVIDAANAPIHNIHFHNDTYRVFRESRLEKGESFILEYLLGHRTVGLPSAVTFRRSAAAEAGYFDEQIGCPLDADLWLRLCQRGDFYYLDEKLLSFRWHDNALKEFSAGSVGYRDLYSLTQKHYQLNADRPVFRQSKSKIFQRLVSLMVPYFAGADAADRSEIRHDFKKMPLSPMQRFALQIRLFLVLLLHSGK